MRDSFKAEFVKLSKSFSYKLLLSVSLIIGVLFCIVLVTNGSTSTGAVAFSIMGTGYI